MVHSDGNLFSILVFFLWIPIALWGARRWPPAKAAALLFLLPLMFLPELVYFDLPGVPHFDKQRIAVFWLLIGVLLFHRQWLGALQLSRWTKLSMLLLLGGRVVTVFLNSDSISDGSVYLPGHQTYDAVTAVIAGTFDYILPFTIAAAMFKDAKDLRVLFRFLVGATLVYGVFQLFEVRFSPQLHTWIYGFFQHSFAQMMRGGGFRPIVFMTHGLAVAMFTMVGVLAAARLYKAKAKVRGVSALWAMAFLLLVALLNKSMAAFLYTLIGVPLVLFFTPKTQFRVAMLLAVTVLLYPALRASNLIPVDDIVEVVTAQFGEQRAASLSTRFDNEEDLLERAWERPFFGWGMYGRSSIYESWSGKQTSISDGDWIITLGNWGLVGFLAKYLLLLLPVFVTARQMRYLRRPSDRRFLSALALMICFSAFDLLPNGNYNYLPFVFSGALVGCLAGMLRHASEQARLKRRRAVAHQLDPNVEVRQRDIGRGGTRHRFGGQ